MKQIGMKRDFSLLYTSFVYVSIFFIYYILFLNQNLQTRGPLGNFFSDMPVHTKLAESYLYESWFTLFTTDFEPFARIPIAVFAYFFSLLNPNSSSLNFANASALALSIAKLLQFLIIKYIINKNMHVSETQSILIAILANFCTVPYLPFLTLNMYIPIGTPNILHNSSTILLTPIAIAFFYSYMVLRKDRLNYKNSFILMLLLVTATLIKPAFTNIILCVMAVYYLFNIRRIISKNLVYDVIIYLPSCLILINQILLIAKHPVWGKIQFTPYKVINYYTSHPFLVLLQAIEFPLLITLVYYFTKKTDKNFIYLLNAWIFFAVAYLVFALFSFSITPLYADLMWSYNISLTLLYIFSIIGCIKIISQDIPLKHNKKYFLMNLCAINLGYIFLSGMNQFIKIYLGGSYI